MTDHIILAVLWMLYGAVHSMLAAGRWKQAMQVWLGAYYKYYTLAYSLFAAIALVGILLYQFSIKSRWLFTMPLWGRLLMLLPAMAGLYIMLVMIRKYFFALSGISVFFPTQPAPVLEQGGLHRYVRHPLYAGTLLFIWSLFFCFPLLSNLLACVIITVYTFMGTILEERKLVAQFGSEYIEYKRRVPMMIPWVQF